MRGGFGSSAASAVIVNQMTLCLGKKRSDQAALIPRGAAFPFLVSKPTVRLSAKFSEDEIKSRFFGRTDVRYITIQRGVQSGRESIKCWPVARYVEFVALFKKAFPEIQVVQIGAATCEKIDGTDSDLRGKTTFEELKALLKYSAVHVDGEGGMVHLRHFMNGGGSVVIFGPTDARIFGYSENSNVFSRPCGCACEWMFDEWPHSCVFSGTPEAACMKAVKPSLVFEKCREILGNAKIQPASSSVVR